MSFIRGGRSGLGYIVSERGKKRLEYQAGDAWFDSGGRDAMAAYCTRYSVMVSDVRKLKKVATLIERVQPEKSKRYAREADSLESQLESDTAKLKMSSAQLSSVPVCVFRASARGGVKRRATATHERFHAKIRSIDNLSCALENVADAWSKSVYGYDALEQFSAGAWTLTGARADAAEEIMARLEEVRRACVIRGKQKECDETRGEIESQIQRHASRPDQALSAFDLLESKLASTGPFDALKRASASCQTQAGRSRR